MKAFKKGQEPHTYRMYAHKLNCHFIMPKLPVLAPAAATQGAGG